MRGFERLFVGVTLFVFLAFLASCGSAPEAGESTDAVEAPDVANGVPGFEVDTNWPTLPDDWTWGQVLGINADSRDHVWLTTGGRVAEFDPEGNPVQVWSARDEAGEWTVIHGLFVDHNDFVWTNAREQHMILKFTREGELVLTIGTLNETGGSNDPNLLGRPAELYVVPETNELFVVDGYSNRRVIVFNGETGEYLRHWGAYGRQPDDEARNRLSDDDPTPAPEFAVVHGITGSHDGLIYVADRTNSRIQVFQQSGDYVTETIIRPGSGAAFSVALSHDPEQEFVYASDGTQHKFWILRRSNMEVLGEFSGEGSEPGQLGRPHNMTTDSKGNIYVAEAEPGRRAQKFAYQGRVAP